MASSEDVVRSAVPGGIGKGLVDKLTPNGRLPTLAEVSQLR